MEAQMEARIVLPGGGRHFDVLGIDHSITLAGEDTGGAYALVEIVNPPGQGIPPHVHTNEEETFHVLEGSVTFQVGRSRWSPRPARPCTCRGAFLTGSQRKGAPRPRCCW